MSWVVPIFDSEGDAAAHPAKRSRVEESGLHSDHSVNVSETRVNQILEKQTISLIDRCVPKKCEDLSVHPRKLDELSGVLKNLSLIHI